jgi:hypothetical protein
MTEVIRDARIDFIKGAAILGVVYIHFAPLICSGNLLIMVGIYISRLSVPFFLVLYCFLLELKIRKGDVGVCVKRQRKLFSSYLAWSLIYFFINSDIHYLHQHPINIITGYWWGYGWPGQYFFLILFQINILFPVIRNAFLHRQVNIVLFIVTILLYAYVSGHGLTGLIEKFGPMPILFWLPYLSLGVFLADIYSNKSFLPWLKNTSKVLIIVVSILVMLGERFFVSVDNRYPYFFVTILLSTFICLPIMFFLLKPGASWFEVFIAKLGRDSMAIFVMNPLVLLVLTPYLQSHRICYFPCAFLLSVILVLFVAGSISFVTPLLNKTALRHIL